MPIIPPHTSPSKVSCFETIVVALLLLLLSLLVPHVPPRSVVQVARLVAAGAAVGR